jgi:hypothetical protein
MHFQYHKRATWQLIILGLGRLVCKHSFPAIHEMNLRTLTEGVDKLALSARLGHSCEME